MPTDDTRRIRHTITARTTGRTLEDLNVLLDSLTSNHDIPPSSRITALEATGDTGWASTRGLSITVEYTEKIEAPDDEQGPTDE